VETKEEQSDKNNTVTWYGIPFFPCFLNHAKTQVVSCQPFTVEARVWTQASAHGIWWGKVFSGCCGFPVSIIELTAPHSHFIHLPPTMHNFSNLQHLYRRHLSFLLALCLSLILQIYSSSSALQPWVGLGLRLRFRNNIFFYRVKLLASCPTPNLEGQGIPFHLGHHPWPVWHGRPYQ